MLLNIQGVGRLSSDVELIYGASGNAIAKFSFASSEKFTAKDGQKKENVCFVECVAFSTVVAICNQYCNKGSQVYISGKLKLDQWTDNNGQKRSKHSITVESMEMLTQRDKSENKEPSVSVNRNPAPQYKTQDNNIPDIDIDEEQIPF